MKKYFLITLGILLIIIGFIFGLAVSLYVLSGVSNDKTIDIFLETFFWSCFILGIYLVKKNSKGSLSYQKSINWDNNLKCIKYLWHTYNTHGVKKRFSSKYLFEWKDIIDISTHITSVHSSLAYKTEILFNNNKTFKLQAVKALSSFSSLNTYSQVLELIYTSNPTIFSVCEKTKFIIEWAKHRIELKDINYKLKSRSEINILFKKAMIHFVELNFSDAKRSLENILKIDPFNSQGLIYLAQIDIDKNQNYQSAIKRFETIINNDRNNIQALRYLMKLYCITDSIKAEDFAYRYLTQFQRDWSSKTLFSQFLFRKEKFDYAMNILKEMQSNIDNNFIKNSISQHIEYIDKFKTDSSFRTKEKIKLKLKILWYYVVLFGGIILMILSFISKIKLKH